MFVVAALLAAALYYLLSTATDAPLLVVLGAVALVGIGLPQLLLYLEKRRSDDQEQVSERSG